jgi:uncharacterized membrane protein YfcA
MIASVGSVAGAVVGAVAIGLSLGTFGSGGSILTVPILVYGLEHADKVAIAESLAIVGGIALVSCVPYARDRLVDWRAVAVFGLPAMVGTYLGAWIAAFVAGYVQLLFFAAVMLSAAVLMWKKADPRAPAPARSDSGGNSEANPVRPISRIAIDGVVVGALTGFVGVGGGFLIVPALVLLARLDMRRAVGTSLVIIAMKSAIGFQKYLAVLAADGVSVNWITLAVFIAGGTVGSTLGKAIGQRLRTAALQRAFAGFLVLMALFIAAREGAALLGVG